MAFRFWKRIGVLPGALLNLSKSGPSLSIGKRGARLTVGSKGIRATFGIPGTGLSYTVNTSRKTASKRPDDIDDDAGTSS